MSICEKGDFSKKEVSHDCFGKLDGDVRLWRIHYSVVDVHSLDTKKVTVV